MASNSKTYPSEADYNRTIVILLLALLLFVFMDRQAKKRTELQFLDIEELTQLPTTEGPAGEVIEEAKKSLLPVIQENSTKVISNIDIKNIQQHVGQFQEANNPAATSYPQISWKKIIGSFSSSSANKAKASSSVQNPGGSIELYFVQYVAKKNKLIATRRWIKKNPLPLANILALLKQGPTSDESSLLNNFTPNIPIYSAKILADGTAVLDLGEGMERYSEHVIQDRLDQLVYTLTQFPEINSVKLLIEGKRKYFLGKIPIESRLTRRQRNVYRYKGV